MARATKKGSDLVAEICLYGTHAVGAGFFARTADGRMFGDGQPNPNRIFTEAIWLAVGWLNTIGITAGKCSIYDAGGARMTVVDLGGVIQNYGSLPWETAPFYTISSQAVIAATLAATTVEAR